MKAPSNPSRRDFLKKSAFAGIGLSLGIQLEACSVNNTISKRFRPGAWITILQNGNTVILISKAEMGQGILTAIPQIIADELESDWSKIKIELADASEKFPVSTYTGASNSIRDLWKPLRIAGATAKQMLIESAALTWNTQASNCYAKNNRVYNSQSDQSLDYGELSLLASTLPVPQNPQLKSTNNFNKIGRHFEQLNAQDIVRGKARYGIDTDLKNLRYAAIVHAPTFDSKVVSVTHTQNNDQEWFQIIELENAIAVIAKSYWRAKKILGTLDITWTQSELLSLSDSRIKQDFARLLEETGEVIKEIGSPVDLPNTRLFSSDYESSFQAHVTMEPMNCTVHVHKDGCDIWAPTQDPSSALDAANKALKNDITYWGGKLLQKLGIPNNIELHPTLMGGGFGRRLEHDFIIEAIQIAKQCEDPVKVLWSREEDIQHDFYRPYSLHRLQASIDQNGNISSWQHKVVGASSGKVAGKAIDVPYDIPHRSLYFTQKDHGIPVGFWRSIAYSHNIFASECFMEELAFSSNQDPLIFRQNLLTKSPRTLNTLNAAVELSDWINKRKHNKALGIALSHCFGSYITTIVELKKEASGFSIAAIFCSIDCGLVVDPDTVRAQIEGGTIFGLNAAIGHSISIENGSVKESNFHDYPLLPIGEIPEIFVHIDKNEHPPTGVGELAVPTVAPAIANAIFLATGVQPKSIPFKLS